MVNPGAFRGKRKVYLVSRKPDYAIAFENGTTEDSLSHILVVYHCLFPPDLPEDSEPTDEEIAERMEADSTVEAPAPTLKGTSEEAMAAYEVELLRWKARQKVLKDVRAAVVRWMAYQYLKDHNMLKKGPKGLITPYATVVHQLSDKPIKRPRLVPAMTIWRRTIRDEIEQEARTRCKAEQKPLKTGLAPIREDIAKTHFNALSEKERDVFRDQAHRDHKAALEQWEENKKNPIDTDPVSRQRCISNLPAVVQPLLDLVAEATGWKLTLLAGGPCPSRGGRMSMLSLHSGTTLGDVPMTFGRFESARYQKYLTPMFTNFLRECYSVEECRERALNEEDEDGGMPGIDESDLNGPTFEELGDSRNPSTLAAPTLVPSAAVPLSTSDDTPDRPPSPAHHSSPSRQPSPSHQSPPLHRIFTPFSPSPSPSAQSSFQLPLDFPSDLSAPTVTAAQAPNPTLAATTPPIPTVMAPAAASTAASPYIPAAPSAPVIPIPAAPTPPTDPTPAARLPSPQAQSSGSGPAKRPAPAVDLDNDVVRRKSARVETSVEGTTRPTTATTKGRKGKGRAVVSPAPVIIGASTQPWFYDCMKLFTEGATGLGTDGGETLGIEWVTLVDIWSRYQLGVGFSVDNKLPTKQRPFPIKEWISRARSTTYRPKITDFKDYETTFNSWWCSMQPTWRVVDGKVDTTLVDGDWSSLQLPGLNGLVSVVAALFYWGIAAHGSKTRVLSWTKAVQECSTAFSMLTP